ncbi:MAG TPA: hypothetical protein VEB63_08535 [Chitinophagaceae bacterium]|nr:hypothetical protein [Chitinophagaceae bacterium]
MKWILALLLLQLLGSPSCSKEEMPDCIRRMTEAPATESPQRIDVYEYRGKTVYFVTEDCCDKFNTVYDERCNAICAPSGGITGQGDRKCPDFARDAKFVRVLWEKGR